MLPALALATAVDLYTMGPGDDVFSRFGHAAICVTDAASPQGRCYNYGTADFSTPLPLTWNFLRGRALFWVSVIDQPRMVAWYEGEDRTVYRQRLPLSPSEAQAVASALAQSTAPGVRYYHYHHFRDNCTTRIRDLLDRALPGRLRPVSEVHDGPTFRALARQGFAGDVPLLVVTDLLLGRPADERTSLWQDMFLPDTLRREVAQRLHAPPEVLSQRRAPLPSGSPRLGQLALCLLGLLLAAAGAALPRRAASAVIGGVLGLLGVLVWGLAALSAFPELVRNEVLLVLWPTDLLLPILPRRYVSARLIALLVCALASAAGLLIQPLWPFLLLAGAPLLALRRRYP